MKSSSAFSIPPVSVYVSRVCICRPSLARRRMACQGKRASLREVSVPNASRRCHRRPASKGPRVCPRHRPMPRQRGLLFSRRHFPSPTDVSRTPESSDGIADNAAASSRRRTRCRAGRRSRAPSKSRTRCRSAGSDRRSCARARPRAARRRPQPRRDRSPSTSSTSLSRGAVAVNREPADPFRQRRRQIRLQAACYNICDRKLRMRP